MLGNIIKQFRKDQGLTQQTLYTNILSKRQAIRFENNEVDIQSEKLISIMKRLELDFETLLHFIPNHSETSEKLTIEEEFTNLTYNSLQDTAPLDFYEKYKNHSDDKVRQMAIISHLNYWPDADLNKSDLLWLTKYYTDMSRLTIAQLEILIKVSFRIDESLVEGTFRRIRENLENYTFHSSYTKLLDIFLTNEFYYYLTNKQLHKAKGVLETYEHKLNINILDIKMNLKIFYNLYDLALTGQEVFEEEIMKILDSLNTIDPDNAQFILDGYSDFIRQIKQIYGFHHGWTDKEIGTVIRLINKVPKKAKKNMGSYLKQVPYLSDTLKKNNHPLSYYVNK